MKRKRQICCNCILVLEAPMNQNRDEVLIFSVTYFLGCQLGSKWAPSFWVFHIWAHIGFKSNLVSWLLGLWSGSIEVPCWVVRWCGAKRGRTKEGRLFWRSLPPPDLAVCSTYPSSPPKRREGEEKYYVDGHFQCFLLDLFYLFSLDVEVGTDLLLPLGLSLPSSPTDAHLLQVQRTLASSTQRLPPLVASR